MPDGIYLKENPAVAAHFERVFNQYLVVNTRRTIAESCNQTLFFIVRNCINQTQVSTPGRIRNDLLAVAQKYNAPLAAILVNKARGNDGLPGLQGQEMAAAVETFIKNREAKRNYLRSRWMPANKILASIVTQKGGASRLPSGLKLTKPTSGGAEPAKESWSPSGRIFAVIEKIRNADTAFELLEEGLEKAVRQEIGSKMQYLLRKRLEEQVITPFNES
jgi:hypothetical protein